MKGIILSAILAGAAGSGGTYAVTQSHQPNLDASILEAQSKRDAADAALLDSIRQLHEDFKAGTAQAGLLDEHVLQIACVIKGCKPQAMR
jgi:hypothetical protein